MARACQHCGEPIPEWMRSDAKYHDDACRVAAWRARRRVTDTGAATDRPDTPPPADAGSGLRNRLPRTEPLLEEPGELSADELVELVKETFYAEEFELVEEAPLG